MRIAIISNGTGGLYGFRKELISELLQNNEIILISRLSGYEDKLTKMGCKIIATDMERRGKNPLSELILMRNYLKILKKENPDLAITYTIKPNIYGGFACRLLKIPYAVNITGLGTAFEKKGMLRSLVILMYKVSLKKAEIVFFENSGNMQIFLDEKIISERQACLLNGAGVNLEHYNYQEYPMDNNEVRFLFVGRVMKEKGIDELFKAMHTLRKTGINCTLDVLGGYEENYKEVVERYEAEGWLHYHGYQEDVRPFIANCHCFVLPSYHEGMANTNLECAASGRPVITSNIPGCKEAVINGVSGLLCESKNAESLYNAMKMIAEMDRKARIAMGKAGRKHVEDVFDKKKVVEKTICMLNLNINC